MQFIKQEADGVRTSSVAGSLWFDYWRKWRPGRVKDDGPIKNRNPTFFKRIQVLWIQVLALIKTWRNICGENVVNFF